MPPRKSQKRKLEPGAEGKSERKDRLLTPEEFQEVTHKKWKEMDRPCPYVQFDQVKLNASGLEGTRETGITADTIFEIEKVNASAGAMHTWRVDCKIVGSARNGQTYPIQIRFLKMRAKGNDVENLEWR